MSYTFNQNIDFYGDVEISFEYEPFRPAKCNRWGELIQSEDSSYFRINGVFKDDSDITDQLDAQELYWIEDLAHEHLEKISCE